MHSLGEGQSLVPRGCLLLRVVLVGAARSVVGLESWKGDHPGSNARAVKVRAR